MLKAIRSLTVLVSILILMIGCSSGSGKTPIIPSDQEKGGLSEIVDMGTLGDTYHSLGVLGKWELTLDEEMMTAELISARTSSLGESYIVSGANFFTMQPCSDCLHIQAIQVTPDKHLQITFSISHPFEKGNTSLPPTAMNRLDLDVFDPALVIVPTSGYQLNYPLMGVRAYPSVCTNVDGYTRELSNFNHKQESCPYFLVVDNSGGGTSNYNRFSMGTKNMLFNTYFADTGVFELYLTMGYGASAVKKTRLTPTYYNPEFNRKAAWKIQVTPPQGGNPPAKGNTWDDYNTTTKYDVTVKVWDWQQNAIVASTYPDPSHPNYIYKASKVSKVSVEIPGMNNSLPTSISPTSGDGSPSNPLVYKVQIANEKRLEAGEHYGLVKVTDERVAPATIVPGQADSLVHSPDGVILEWYPVLEFATYQVFTATVVIGERLTVTNPNGGEEWTVLQPATVEWDTVGTTTSVDIDLSIDSGVNYPYSIASDIPNTGSFNIASLGNWPTEHARIKVTNADDSTIKDQSDGDFCIICTTVLPPTNVQASDGTFYDRVRITWDAVGGATGYNVYRNNVLVKENTSSTTWDDMTVTSGVVYNYQLQTKQGACVSQKSPIETGYACLTPPAPTGLNASDGSYSDRVALSWNAASGATSYNIYRNSALLQSGVVGTTYNDFSVARGVIYTYEVESQNLCGPSSSKSTPNTGYAAGCSSDTDNSCGAATKTYLNGYVSGCVDQIDTDWYHFYVSPKGFTSASKITLTTESGKTVSVTVYGVDPGGSCPGTQLHSVTNVGSTTITMPSSSTLSHIYVKIIGYTGMVDYAMQMGFVPALSNLDVEIYVATTNGTSSGTWPTNGATPLNHTTLLTMMTWANSWWNTQGYNLVWDGAENFMASKYYNLDYYREDIEMHTAYGYTLNPTRLSLYFVDQHYLVNTAYCVVWYPQTYNTVRNVFSVYLPQVWTWENAVAHEHGHGIGYLQDQYLYDLAPCDHCNCGDDACLSTCLGWTQFLFSDPYACYNGNEMYFSIIGWTWDKYNLTNPQNSSVHEFHYIYSTNFPWY